MELLALYLGHSMDLLNGVTGFSARQSLGFIYWSQTDDFKDNLKFSPRLAPAMACGLIIAFFGLYAVALYALTDEQVQLLGLWKGLPGAPHLPPPLTADVLQQYAWTSMGQRVVAIAVFHSVSLLALTRYFLGQYSAASEREASAMISRP